MSLSKKFAAIRAKPRRVRERYLIVTMLVVAPALIVVGILTYHYDASTSGSDFFKSVGANVASSFSNPAYDDTFGSPSFKNPAVSATASSTPADSGTTATSTPAATSTPSASSGQAVTP